MVHMTTLLTGKGAASSHRRSPMILVKTTRNAGVVLATMDQHMRIISEDTMHTDLFLNILRIACVASKSSHFKDGVNDRKACP